SFSYALITGAGDNGSFTISGNQLKTAQSFDFEAKASYSIRLRTTDLGNQSFEKQLTITITNANDAPTDIALDTANIDENKPSGSNVGNFSTTRNLRISVRPRPLGLLGVLAGNSHHLHC